jgi:hypothetical protein
VGGGNLSVSVTGPSTGVKNTPLTFTGNASGGTGSYTYFWQCDYNPLASFAQFGQTATCTYSASGPHTIAIYVRDSGGAQSQINTSFTVTIGGLASPSVQTSLSGNGVTQNIFNGRYTAPTSTPIVFRQRGQRRELDGPSATARPAPAAPSRIRVLRPAPRA